MPSPGISDGARLQKTRRAVGLLSKLSQTLHKSLEDLKKTKRLKDVQFIGLGGGDIKTVCRYLAELGLEADALRLSAAIGELIYEAMDIGIALMAKGMDADRLDYLIEKLGPFKPLGVSRKADQDRLLLLIGKAAMAADLSEELHKHLSPDNERDNKSSQLTEKESNIVETVDSKVLTGQKIADLAGYTFNSDFRRVLASMVKRGILAKPGRKSGYCLPGFVTDKSPDKSDKSKKTRKSR